MKKIAVVSFGAALAAAALSVSPASAGPFGSVAGIREASALPLVDVQYRRRVARRNNGAAVAAGLIGAAIVGGAIIANSQPRRRYYDDGYYYHDGGYAPGPYYGGNVQVQYHGGYRHRYDANPPPPPGSVAVNPDGSYTYWTPGGGVERSYNPYRAQRQGFHPYHTRQMRDPATGGVMR